MDTLEELTEELYLRIKHGKKIPIRRLSSVAQNTDSEQFQNWLIEHDFFDRHVFFLVAINNSNKKHLLENIIPEYYIRKKNPYGFFLCHTFIDKEIDTDKLLEILPNLSDRLALYSWAISHLKGYPYSPAAIIFFLTQENNFGIKPCKYNLYGNISLPKKNLYTGKFKNTGNKNDSKNANLSALYEIKNSLIQLLINDLDKSSNFEKFLILSGLTTDAYHLKSSISPNFRG